MEEQRSSYLSDTADAEDAVQYLVDDANAECNTSLSSRELEKIAREVLAEELAMEKE